MHPITREFIDSKERLTLILEKYYDKDQYLETVFLRLCHSMQLDTVDSKTYLEIDQAIIKGHPDTNVYLLFISFAILFTSTHSDFERSNVIRSIGNSISLEKFHPVVHSYFIATVAGLKLYERKVSECNILIKESIALVNKKSPRYFYILLNLATLMAHQGRLKDLDKADLAILDSTIKDESLMASYIDLMLSNYIITGNYKEGIKLIDENKNNPLMKMPILLQSRINLLNILSGNFNEKNFQEVAFQLLANACNFLSNGNMEEALKYSKLIHNGNFFKFRVVHFEQYIPLHIELCLKNKGLARLIFQEMQQKNYPHYLDDFFLARIQLLEMNKTGAYESFSRLIENVNHYGAMNRLLFEVQFAKEMSSSDILLLMNGMRDDEGIKIKPNKKELLNTYSHLGKGVKLLIGDSTAIAQVKKLVKKFANLKEPVLITGETGTGKELVARAIHEESSHSKEPFLAINCGALTESLLQSELFGYVAGAFTGAQKERQGIFEAAGKGTVFLDEFGDISPIMQVSLLRVLESNEIRLIGGTKSRQIECKMVIATNTNLQQAVEERKFREDLYFRLTRFDIKLPPLRDRIEDIPKLVSYFLIDQENQNGMQKQISKQLLEALKAYRWPGNIRELKNEIERLKILHSDKDLLNLEDFDFTHLQGAITTLPKHESEIIRIKDSGQKLKIQELSVDDDHVLKIVQRGSKIEIRQNFFKDLFKKYKKLTRSQIIEITSISPGTASKDLKILCNAGFIKKITPTNSVKSHYFVWVE